MQIDQQRRIPSFVLRQGHLSAAQRKAMDEGLPIWGIPYNKNLLDLTHVFGRSASTILEIGFGMGQATSAIATAHPHHNYLALEVHTPGIGSLCKLIQAEHIENIRIVQYNAVEVLEHMVPLDSLDGVHIFFPDPWPKKRHHKRRLIQPAFIQLLAARIKPGGYIHLATDWEHYAQQMLAVLSNNKMLANTCIDFSPKPSYRPITKFEQRGLRLGHHVRDLIFVRLKK